MSVSMRRSGIVVLVSAGLLVSPFLGSAVAEHAATIAVPVASAKPVKGQTADAPRLQSVVNFRDLAGTGEGYQAQGSHHLNKGVFYRSNALTPNDADLATLDGLHLSSVFDLRSADEIAQKADRMPAGAAYVNIPIFSGNLSTGMPSFTSPDAARKFMQDINKSFVTDAGERGKFADLLTQLAEQQGPAVFHCTAGKDRTGWTAYLLQSIARVSDADIMSDYLLSNDYLAASNAATLAQIKAAKGEQAAAIYAPLLGVDRTYLQAGIDQLTADYGSVDKYLKDGLGLNGHTIEQLRHKLIQ
ncbi:tyrosine-protein phosphatase [Nocardia sp. CDC153]|uniref:tyrosine-protein phosphatase n=1 Tax=Nocardia sp. CDC153 TaxID=3112167 RepID=UPI002DBC617E|nr:tyrosine-protein phosphatase [Nocardia sp. CDC153]MEC3952827.1 tyrosine-protein phosphatase [Nocardia sp. CDC153]